MDTDDDDDDDVSDDDVLRDGEPIMSDDNDDI